MPRKPSEFTLAVREREMAKARLEAAAMNRRAAILAENKVDVLQASQQKKRRQPVIETLAEEKQLRLHDRLRGINLTRDLHRNFGAAKAMANQRRNNVVGTGPKLMLHTGSAEFNAEASKWFNGPFAKNCDFRGELDADGNVVGGLHLAEQIGLAFDALPREGDVLCVFDDGIIENSGKFLWYEADQLVDVSNLDAAPSPWNKYEQQDGVLYDKYGRTVGYAVTALHGRQSLPHAEVTFLPAHKARLVKRQWRLNQLRGWADMLTTAADLQDLYELRGSEMQTAKTLSKFAGVVKKKDGAAEIAWRREQGGATDPATGQQLPNADGGVTYDRLGELTGGLLEYMEDGDDFQPLDFNRPSVNFREANDHILRGAGAAHGLSKTYTTLNTEASYTAFRGDLLLSWTQFYVDQKDLERKLVDWMAQRAITWAIENGKIQTSAPDGWSDAMSWSWPEMPAVDPLKESMANISNLKHLLTSYAEIIGPNWRELLKQIADEKAEVEGNKLPELIFQQEQSAAERAALATAGAGAQAS